jgi:hypothetical protein
MNDSNVISKGMKELKTIIDILREEIKCNDIKCSIKSEKPEKEGVKTMNNNNK